MKELKKKIQELIEVSKKDYKEFLKEGIEKGNFNLLFGKINMQNKLMDEIKELAKENNTLLGRIVKFPHADSYAYYIVTKINKVTVRLTWLDYADAWIDDRCGYECNIDYSYVQETINGEDQLDYSFRKSKS